MKKVTFTAHCAGIGAVYNKGDVAVFPDGVADAIVAAKKGTAQPIEEKAAPPPRKTGGKTDGPPVVAQGGKETGDKEPEEPESGTS